MKTREFAVSDGQWIQETVRQYERPLTQYAAHLLRDPEAARDVVQEIFTRLCAANRADLDGHVAQWLYTACRNRVVDVLRKERRMKPLTDATLAIEPASAQEPGRMLEMRDNLSAVMRALGALPAGQQEVVRLKFQQGLSYRQIAAVTGHSIGNVGFLLHTAIHALRKRIGEKAD